MIVLISLLLLGCAHNKRGPIEVAKPIQYKGLEYQAHEDPEKMGIVTVVDHITNKEVGRLRIYKPFIWPFLEKDVQWVFITDMKINWPFLYVVNEKGKKYSLNISKLYKKP